MNFCKLQNALDENFQSRLIKFTNHEKLLSGENLKFLFQNKIWKFIYIDQVLKIIKFKSISILFQTIIWTFDGKYQV